MRFGEVTMKIIRMHRVITVAACLLPLLAEKADAQSSRSHQARDMLSRDYYDARGLFEKLWKPGEASEKGGDGVGPLYNERSCLGCHNLGGTGGAGGNASNVTILAALPGASVAGNSQAIFQGELEDLHPGFRNKSSIVLHLHSTSTAEEERLAKIRAYALVQTRDDLFALSSSQRSTPALFGAGRIDAIPDRALLDAEARSIPAFPEIKGRVSRLKGGRLGKFGWKGQTASLKDFVMAACANELGLEVRGHHQASFLSAKEFDPKKISFDMSDAESSLMIRFVANLPAPIVHRVGDAEWGFEVFKAIGCAICHAPSLGGVDRLYSDLLLHDLGDRFRAFGGGYGSVTSEIIDRSSGSKQATPALGEAGPTEWRTTPLWGVAHSAPYLHDGRASTLNEAITLHGGEAEKTSKRYAALASFDRQALLAFLHSQVAPPQPGRSVPRALQLPAPSPPAAGMSCRGGFCMF
jgi:CxxC motif-containing protein (DUF1111 family)